MSFEIEIAPKKNNALAAAVVARWNSLTKPPGSLGRLESLVLQLGLMTGTASPALQRKAMLVFCADHGVTAEGVSAFPKEVTVQMVANFLAGGAAISVLCKQFALTPIIVDTGIDGDPVPGAVDLRIGRGTANFTQAPAMSNSQAEQALQNGIGLANGIRPDFDIAGVGEMGIGNTTAASALLCAFGDVPPEDGVGPGTGVTATGIHKKAAVITRALATHATIVSRGDPVGILAALGGFEIATMAGFLLGAASLRMPVVVDGFISSSAAVVARAINPTVMDYLLFSHLSAETAHARMLALLGVKPVLNLEMRLGEGTGAAMAMPLLDAALALYNGMATFQEGHVSEK